MARFRLLIQGEGAKPDGQWFGFYAGREIQADSEDAAIVLGLAAMDADWAGASSQLGTLTDREVIAAWARPLLSWKRTPGAGHAFFNDDRDAQEAALRLEAEICHAPRPVLDRLLSALD